MIRRVCDINGRMARERKFWDRSAGRYDLFVRFAGLPYGRIKELMREELKPDDMVFEAASGTGDVALFAAGIVKHVKCIDISPDMVELSRVKAGDRNIDNVEFDVGDAYELNVEDRSADVVIAVNFLHVLIEPEHVLAEFRRILKDGGVLIVPVYCHGESRISRFMSRCMGITGFKAYNRWSVEGFRTFIEENGFKVQRSVVIKGAIPLEYIMAVKPPKLF